MDTRKLKRAAMRGEIIDRIIAAVKGVDIAAVIGEEIPLRKKGRSYYGLCPFHADEHEGAFVVTPSKGIFKCFACGAGGNAVSFRMQRHNQKYLEAAADIALECGGIDRAEHDLITDGRRAAASEEERVMRALSSEKDGKPTHPTAPAGVRACVYGAMPAVCGLSDVHRKHLLEARGLPEDALRDYFTFPTRRVSLAAKLLEEIQKRLAAQGRGDGYVAHQMAVVKRWLAYVPGFFVNQRGEVDFMSCKGIGFLVRDIDGRPLAVHRRRDEQPGESGKSRRYDWFSSSFAEDREGCEGGGSSGAPAGVLWPKRTKDGGPAPVALTEGRFKAEHLAMRGFLAVYLSGVGLWRNAMPAIREALKRTGGDVCYLAFDADQTRNQTVARHLMDASAALEKDAVRAKALLWPLAAGKGFDDLVLGQGEAFKGMVAMLPMPEYASIYKAAEAAWEALCAGSLAEAGKEAQKAALQAEVETRVWPNGVPAPQTKKAM